MNGLCLCPYLQAIIVLIREFSIGHFWPQFIKFAKAPFGTALVKAFCKGVSLCMYKQEILTADYVKISIQSSERTNTLK